jgi:hypothetical protein
VLMAHPGDNPVVFELTQPGDFRARLRSRRPAGVKADDQLLANLQMAYGVEAVSLERQNSGG